MFCVCICYRQVTENHCFNYWTCFAIPKWEYAIVDSSMYFITIYNACVRFKCLCVNFTICIYIASEMKIHFHRIWPVSMCNDLLFCLLFYISRVLLILCRNEKVYKIPSFFSVQRNYKLQHIFFDLIPLLHWINDSCKMCSHFLSHILSLPHSMTHSRDSLSFNYFSNSLFVKREHSKSPKRKVLVF